MSEKCDCSICGALYAKSFARSRIARAIFPSLGDGKRKEEKKKRENEKVIAHERRM